MNGYIAGIVLPEDRRTGAVTATTGRMSASVGTYSLRRAHYLAESTKPRLSVEQQFTLIQLFREGDSDAKRKLVAHNMHLVVDFAKCHANRGLSLLDLVRVGTQGIIESLETYDPEGDLSLSAYTSKCICRNIEEAIMNRNNSAAVLRAKTQAVAPIVNVGNSGWK